MSSSRKLAAILFTDIVGYTAMMQQDEEHAVKIIKRYVTVLKEVVANYEGEVLNDYGDGSLCIFSSATEAMRCAVEIQKQLQTEPVVPLRIGLHMGEIFFEDGKILGDGVNVASRIQSLGQANTILFSAEINNAIRNHPEFKIVSLGDFDFKNVNEPMEVFALANDGLIIPIKEQMSGKLKQDNYKKKTKAMKIAAFAISILVLFIFSAFLYSKYFNQQSKAVDRSLAVLPFINISDDPKQDYFTDGMMDEILNHLFKIGDLDVISRTSSMAYKGTKKNSKEIANELGVSNLLEGSVQKDGDHIRIIMQLIDAKNDRHLWAETYDREFKDVFAIQSDIAKQVADALKLKLDAAVKERIEHIATKNTEAYNLYLQATEEYLENVVPLENSIKKFEHIIALDSGFADAYARLGKCWLDKGGYDGDLNREEVLLKAEPLLQKALQLNPDLAPAHLYKSFIELWFRWNFEAADQEYKKVLELNPSNKRYIASFSDFLNATGRHQEALHHTLDAFKKDKNYRGNWTRLAENYFYNKELFKADEMINAAASLFSDDIMIWYYLKIKIYIEKYIDAVTFFEKTDSTINPSLNPTKLAYIAIAYYKTGQKEKTQKALEILKAKSLASPLGSPCFCIAAIYAAMGQDNEAIKWLEKAYTDHEVEMYWLKVEPMFRPLHTDPQFQEILRKIGFTS